MTVRKHNESAALGCLTTFYFFCFLLPGVNNLLGEDDRLHGVMGENLQQQATNFVRFTEKVREKKISSKGTDSHRKNPNKS
jgi:hypothetical protein